MTLNAVIQLFSQDTLAYDNVSSDQVWLPRNQQFRKYRRKNYILIIWALNVTLTLKIATNKICMTLWLIMLHHYTKFGNKKFCDSEDITWTNIHRHSEPLLWPWSWTQQSHFSTGHTSLWCCTIKSSLAANGLAVQKIIHSHILMIQNFAVTWHWTLWTSFSAWNFGLWCCITIPGLITKCSVVQKISSGQIFINILNLCCDLDLKHSNPIFPLDTPAYDAVLSNQVWF